MIDCGVWLDVSSGKQEGRFERLADHFAVTSNRTESWLRVAINSMTMPLRWNGQICRSRRVASDSGSETKPKKPWPELQHVLGIALDPADAILAVGHRPPVPA